MVVEAAAAETHLLGSASSAAVLMSYCAAVSSSITQSSSPCSFTPCSQAPGSAGPDQAEPLPLNPCLPRLCMQLGQCKPA